MQLNLSNPEQCQKFLSVWHEERHRARTDLLWLCNNILGYKDVSREVHGDILDALQKFPGATEFHKDDKDVGAAFQGKILWEPKFQMETLPPNDGFEQNRDNQFLYPRGHLKSTIITVAHSIQWWLNYPNCRILLTTATETLGVGFVIEIRNHFIQNEGLRFLFPDICPLAKDGKIPELGNMGGFTLPCRDNSNKKLGPGGKEPSLLASTVGSSITGYHGDVEKNDDLVEKINASSQNGIDDVIRHFGSLWDLLEKYNSDDPERPLHGWQDTVGTPWDYSDLYQVRRNQQAELASQGKKQTVNMVIRSAAPNWPEGPFLWPQRMGYVALKAIEDDPTKGPAQLSAQYLMNPIVFGTGLIDDIKNLCWIEQMEMVEKLRGVSLTARMDLAGMDTNAKGGDNDYTVLTVGGFSDGTLLIPFIRHGRPAAEGAVEWIFDVFREYPHLLTLTVEKASGGSVLESWLRREMSARNIWLPVSFVTRSNKEAKVTRIKALRPWFEKQQVAFSKSIPFRTALEAEIKGFPKYRHDDILDTISDLMVDSRGQISGGVVTNGVAEVIPYKGKNLFEAVLSRMDERDNFEEGTHYDPFTGWAA